MRLILLCGDGNQITRIIVKAEDRPEHTGHIAAMEGNAAANTRSKRGEPAIFAPEDMKAVTAVGEP